MISLDYATWDVHGPVIGVVASVAWRRCHEGTLKRRCPLMLILHQRVVHFPATIELVEHLRYVALFARRHGPPFIIELGYAFHKVTLKGLFGASQHI